jgi:hypothetical protein
MLFTGSDAQDDDFSGRPPIAYTSDMACIVGFCGQLLELGIGAQTNSKSYVPS